MAAKRKLSQFQLAQKALMTSSAQRRFRAEDNPEEEDIREHDIGMGAPLDAEDWEESEKAKNREARLEEEQFKQDLLLRNVPHELHAEAIRRYREARRKREFERRQRAQGIAEAARQGALRPNRGQTIDDLLVQEEPYVYEDNAAKAIRHNLSGLVNKQATAADLAVGGPTVPHLGGPRQSAGPEEQLTTAHSDKERRRARSEEEIQREYEETFTPGPPPILSDEARVRVSALETRRRQLIGLEQQIKQRQQQAPGARPVKETSANLSKLRKNTRREILKVEKQLGDVDTVARVEGQARTRTETNKLIRDRLNESLETVIDPLAPELRRGGVQTRRSLPPQVTQGDINKFVRAATMSHHAATPRHRAEAAALADRVLGRISQKTQEEVTKRQEEADRRSVLETLIPHPQFTHEGRVAEAVSPAGIPPYEDLKRARESARERLRPRETGPPLDSFERALAAGRGVSMPPPPRTPGAPPGFDRPGWRSPNPAIKDPRLNELTVEDVYEAYGHEKTAPRLRWEVDRLKARLSDDEFNNPKPAVFHSIKQQGKFVRDQAKGRWKGFTEGTDLYGVNERGQRIALPGRGSRTLMGTSPRARIGSTPNKMYEYKLRNPRSQSDEAFAAQNTLDDLITQREELLARAPELKSSQSLRGSVETQRDINRELHPLNDAIRRQTEKVNQYTGPTKRKLYPTDTKTQFHVGRRDRFGQLYPGDYDEIVAPVRETSQQEETFSFKEGIRQPKTGKERLPEAVDEIRYIPVPGAKGETRTVSDPENITKVITEVQDVRGRWTPIPRDEYEESLRERQRWETSRRGTAPPLVQERSIPRKIQYKYMDPKDLELLASQRDIASFKIPKKGRLNERLLHLQFSDESSDPESLWNKVPGKALRVHGQAAKLEAAKEITESEVSRPDLLEKHGIRDRSEAKQLMEAAVAAGFYANRARFTQGHIPNVANKIINKIPGTNKYNVAFDVNEAYVRPGIERVSQIPYLVSHPISSPTGSALGLDFTSIKHRQEFIKKQTLARRALEKQEQQLARIQRTAEFVEKHKEKRGPLGAYTRWRLEPLSRAKDYRLQKVGEPDNMLSEAARTAHEATKGTFSYHRRRTDRQELINLDPRSQAAGAKLQGRYYLLKKELEKNPFAPSVLGQRPNFVKRGFEHPGSERNLMIAGAVVGTAAGAGYLYHRHQEKKKPEAEKVSFYNKVLPPAFETPKVIPEVRVTKVVRLGDSQKLHELGLARKELPVELGARLHKKRIALRPSDRGYDPNLPLVGGISLRGTPGGSKSKGLVYYGTDTPKRTNIKRSTHEVHILGKKLPGALKIGNLRDVQLSGRNPRRLTADERESLIWAHEGTDLEENVKAFYRGMGGENARRLLETWDTPEEVDRIRREKGRKSREYRQFERTAVRERQRIGR